MAFNRMDPSPEVAQMRQQGLTDSLIMEEMTRKGHSPDNVHQALSAMDGPPMPPMDMAEAPTEMRSPPARGADGNIYERIEEIAEGIIDEKWDELIEEVKKIVAWKEKIEATQTKINHDVEKLQADFTTLHKGVLGKLEQYDDRMRDVGTELQAVGKVFKDVIPTFVENVKELAQVTEGMKKK